MAVAAVAAVAEILSEEVADTEEASDTEILDAIIVEEDQRPRA